MGFTNPTEPYFQNGGWGYDGSQWRRLGLVWGYSDRLVARAYTETATAGTNILSLAVVPDGQVWSVTRMTAVDLNSTTTYIAFAIVAGGDEYRLGQQASVAANTSFSIQGPIIAKAGDILRAILGGCTLNDDLYFWLNGFLMTVNLG